jgi:hypothetical protein
MGISPWYKTNTPTAPKWTIQLVPDTGSFDVTNLTTGNFSLLMRNVDTGVETTGAGTFSNITAAVLSGSTVVTPASVQYQAASGDVVAGMYQNFVLVTLSNGIEPFKFGELWQVIQI